MKCYWHAYQNSEKNSFHYLKELLKTINVSSLVLCYICVHNNIEKKRNMLIGFLGYSMTNSCYDLCFVFVIILFRA